MKNKKLDNLKVVRKNKRQIDSINKYEIDQIKNNHHLLTQSMQNLEQKNDKDKINIESNVVGILQT